MTVSRSALLLAAGLALAAQESNYAPRAMYCGGNMLVSMGELRASHV
jgi:hypothetical protein